MSMLQFMQMNLRSTTPATFRAAALAALCVGLCCVAIGTSSQFVGATNETSAEAKIAKLSDQIESLSAAARANNDQSNTVKIKLEALKRERETLQAQLNQTSQDLESLTRQIAALSTKLDQRRSTLGEVIADQSIESSITPFEMLMSSRSISDYFNRSTYRATLQDSIDQSLKQIAELNEDLKTKQATMKRLQQEQQSRIVSVTGSIEDSTDKLVVIDGQSTHMSKLTTALASEKSALQNQQQQQIQSQMDGAEQVSPGSLSIVTPPMATKPSPVTQLAPTTTPPATPTTPTPSTPSTPAPTPVPVTLPNGGYPAYLNNCYVDANALSYGLDPWGYGCRQCVSYTAWKVFQKSGRTAMYWGNANMWPNSARARGYQTSTTPRAGSVGVMMSGPYGHVVWVESVNANGTINVSQYNYWLPNKPNGGWGYYSEFRNVRASTYQTYIYI